MTSNVFKYLSQAPSEIRSTKNENLSFSLEEISHFDPFTLVRWKSLFDLAHSQGNKINVKLPNNTDAKNYAGRMGLFENTDYQYPHDQNDSSRFFQLMKITDDRNDRIYDECKKILDNSNVPSNYITDLSEAFAELADNIYYHSGPSDNSGWGYIHGQVYGNHRIEVALSDVGVSVYGSYKRRNQLRGRTEEQIIKDIFEEAESSLNQAGRGHRGLGLNEVKNFISSFKGNFDMWTGNFFLRIDKEGVHSGPHGMGEAKTIKTEGTWIQMKIPIV